MILNPATINTFSLEFPQVCTLLSEVVEWRLMYGRETKTTISDLLRMPRHEKEIISEKWLKVLILRAKRVGQLTCGTEKHRSLFFQQAETKGHFIRGAKSQSEAQNLVTSFTRIWIRPVQ